MECKICKGIVKKIFKKKVLLKYDVSYYQCENCQFVQTDTPFWLDEAYNSAITSLDIGLLLRANYLVKETIPIINSCFPESKIMLDFAGGYGNYVRLMRDAGFNFFRQDDYCSNLFATHFDVSDIETKKFDLVTGFEVLEHLSNPLDEIARVFTYADEVIFSTELLPTTVNEIEKWIYISQETGQHIAFYSSKAMEIIATKFNKNYYCKNNHIHIFTSKIVTKSQISYALDNKTTYRKYLGLKIKKIKKYNMHRESLMPADRAHIIDVLYSKS